MKLVLSKWTESVGHAVKTIQNSVKGLWITIVPSQKKKLHNKKIRTVKILAYKTVDKKVRPVPSHIPSHMKVQQKFPQNPLLNLPSLPFHPPEFQPTEKVTKDRMDSLGLDNNTDLLPEEKQLLQHIITINEWSIAFSEPERGTFRTDYFSDYKMPVMDHVPWMEKNMGLPQGYQDQIIKLLKEKIDAGVYETAQSSY